MNINAERGSIRRVSIGKRAKLSPGLVSMNMGWEVQYRSNMDGWRKVVGLPVVSSIGVAEMMKDEVIRKDAEFFNQDTSNEYRVYELVGFPV